MVGSAAAGQHSARAAEARSVRARSARATWLRPPSTASEGAGVAARETASSTASLSSSRKLRTRSTKVKAEPDGSARVGVRDGPAAASCAATASASSVRAGSTAQMASRATVPPPVDSAALSVSLDASPHAGMTLGAAMLASGTGQARPDPHGSSTGMVAEELAHTSAEPGHARVPLAVTSASGPMAPGRRATVSPGRMADAPLSSATRVESSRQKQWGTNAASAAPRSRDTVAASRTWLHGPRPGMPPRSVACASKVSWTVAASSAKKVASTTGACTPKKAKAASPAVNWRPLRATPTAPEPSTP
mmetsp:Transcript_12466/g.37364  ORF Transcript_12466/g.37364 Transcript_12466/m.37364 type:complete len:306 (-) Transcript_12466:55-972(-)